MNRLLSVSLLTIGVILGLCGLPDLAGQPKFDPKKLDLKVVPKLKYQGPDPAIVEVKVTPGNITPSPTKPYHQVAVTITATVMNVGTSAFTGTGALKLVTPVLAIAGTPPKFTTHKSVPFGALPAKQTATLSHTVTVSYHPKGTISNLANYEVHIEYGTNTNPKDVDVDPSEASNRAKVKLLEVTELAFNDYFRNELRQRINQERAAFKRSPLASHQILDDAAQQHAKWMRDNNTKIVDPIFPAKFKYFGWDKVLQNIDYGCVQKDVFTVDEAFQGVQAVSYKPDFAHGPSRMYYEHYSQIGIGYSRGWTAVYFGSRIGGADPRRGLKK